MTQTEYTFIRLAHPKVDVTKYDKERKNVSFEFGANFEMISMLTLDWFANKYPAYHHTVISTAMSAQIRMKTRIIGGKRFRISVYNNNFNEIEEETEKRREKMNDLEVEGGSFLLWKD
ncbi:hypothetical protein V1477_014011 [Vespula maculifrons]|uniref:Uncharacterized protein n=1 Tax=Vespula maculifrons TaxID=7453 RepID=A0ABD2BLD3_VESMC